jgi:hypothetical protein
MASSTVPMRAWPLMSSRRTSLITVPNSSTNVNTATVSSSAASTWNVRYLCSVLIELMIYD